MHTPPFTALPPLREVSLVSLEGLPIQLHACSSERTGIRPIPMALAGETGSKTGQGTQDRAVRVFSGVLSLLGVQRFCFSSKVARLGYYALGADRGHAPGPLPHSRSPATPEEEDCLQRWGEDSIGECGALHLVWPREGIDSKGLLYPKHQSLPLPHPHKCEVGVTTQKERDRWEKFIDWVG